MGKAKKLIVLSNVQIASIFGAFNPNSPVNFAKKNGDFITAELHTAMDPKGHTGLNSALRQLNPMMSKIRQQINRMPYTSGGAIYGATSKAFLDSTTECGCGS